MGWLKRREKTAEARPADLAVRAAGEIDVGQPPPPLPESWHGVGWPISAALYAEPGTLNPGDMPLNRDTVKMVPAVRRGVRLMSGAIASMAMERWRGLDRLPPGMLAQIEPDRAYVTTMTLTVEDLILFPYAWWKVLERDDQGFPKVCRRLEPEHVSVQREPDGAGVVERAFVTYRGKEVPQRDLIRFDGPDEGLLCLGRVEIETALRLELAARVYASPEVPTGYLKNTGQYELPQPKVTELLDAWRIGRMTRSTAFLNGNVDYVNTFATPDTLQLVQGREETAAQIARLLNLPPRYVGAKSGDSMTYSTQRAERQDLLDFSLSPYFKPIAQRLSMSDINGSPRGQEVRFSGAAFLATDPREAAEIAEILIRSGQSTANEQREERGLAPLAEPQEVPANA